MSESKIKAQEVLDASKGMLQKQLYVVFTTPTNGMGPVMENQEEHLKHQARMEREGIYFGAGPFWTDDEEYWEGEGMFIVRAESLDEAKRIADSDPMHSSGARSYTCRPWLLNEGTLTVKVTYSNGGREII